MGRTTDEKKGHTIILRVTEDLYGELKRNSELEGVGLSEYTREILLEKLLKKNNVIHPIDEECMKDLEKMCQVSGITVERFLEKVRELFNDGFIYMDGYTIKTKGKYDLSRLEDICHRGNLDVQDVIDKLVSRMTR